MNFNPCSGAVGARLSSDASTLRSLVGDALALIVQNVATVMAALFMSFTAHWKLALIILIPIPLVGLQEFLRFKLVQGLSGDVKVHFYYVSDPAGLVIYIYTHRHKCIFVVK